MLRNIAILGAGALGASYGTKFYTHPQFSTVFIAKGERAERLRQNGVVVNATTYHIPVADPVSQVQPADLIIVALKHQHLHSAKPNLAPFIGPETAIISVMNGLDSEKIIGALYGMDNMLYAIAVGIDALRVGNVITYTTIGKIIFGEAQNKILSSRVREIQAAFQQAGIGYDVPDDMIRSLWWKFMVNVGMNQASAVTGAPYGTFQSSPEAQSLMEALMHEVITLAAYEGVNLVNQDIAEWYGFLNTLSAQGKTSMLQDIEARRASEVEIFGGKVVELGALYKIPTPVNETVLRIIRVIEAGYR